MKISMCTRTPLEFVMLKVTLFVVQFGCGCERPVDPESYVLAASIGSLYYGCDPNTFLVAVLLNGELIVGSDSLDSQDALVLRRSSR